MDRQKKLMMAQQKQEAGEGGPAARTVGGHPERRPAFAADLRRMGIATPAELPGRDPYTLYDELCRITAQRHDPCLLDTFIPPSGTWRERRGAVMEVHGGAQAGDGGAQAGDGDTKFDEVMVYFLGSVPTNSSACRIQSFNWTSSSMPSGRP